MAPKYRSKTATARGL